MRTKRAAAGLVMLILAGCGGGSDSAGGPDSEVLGEARVSLDPDAPPQPGDQSVRLLVNEAACAGGGSAEGRIRVPVLEMAADEVRVEIGVVHKEGLQNCPSNPDTPFVLDLPEPLGDRKLIDVSKDPGREISAAPVNR